MSRLVSVSPPSGPALNMCALHGVKLSLVGIESSASDTGIIGCSLQQASTAYLLIARSESWVSHGEPGAVDARLYETQQRALLGNCVNVAECDIKRQAKVAIPRPARFFNRHDERLTMIDLGQPTGPRLRDLTLVQEKLLDNWLTLTLIMPIRAQADMPVDFTRALAALAKRRNIRFKFSSHGMRLKGEVALGRNVPGCVGGSKRKVTVAGRESMPGERVSPWDDRQWREHEMIP